MILNLHLFSPLNSNFTLTSFYETEIKDKLKDVYKNSKRTGPWLFWSLLPGSWATRLWVFPGPPGTSQDGWSGAVRPSPAWLSLAPPAHLKTKKIHFSWDSLTPEDTDTVTVSADKLTHHHGTAIDPGGQERGFSHQRDSFLLKQKKKTNDDQIWSLHILNFRIKFVLVMFLYDNSDKSSRQELPVDHRVRKHFVLQNENSVLKSKI